MPQPTHPTDPPVIGYAKVFNALAWGGAVIAFVMAWVGSYREIHYNIPNDLRSPTILMLDAGLAAVVAVGFALHQGSLTRWGNILLCLRFGLWSAAIFRLVPPFLNEGVALYYKNCGTFDLPYVVLGAVIHGGLAVLLACPYVIQVLDLPLWDNGKSQLEMGGAVVLIFFLVASITRLLA